MVEEALQNIEQKMAVSVDVLKKDLASIRTGHATPALIEHIKVEYNGVPLPLNQLATISAPEARLLVIQPWDPAVIPAIEKAIQKSNLGINPSCDGKVIRLPLPPLSRERRDELVKLVKRMAEEGRVSLRTIRHQAKESIEKLQRDKVISEDEKFRRFQDLQKLIDKYNARLEEILKNKEKEILEF